MTRQCFLLLFILVQVQSSQCYGHAIRKKNCVVPEKIKCPSNTIIFDLHNNCRCRYNCQAASVHCNTYGRLQMKNRNDCPAEFKSTVFQSASGVRMTIWAYSKTNDNFRVICYTGKTVTPGNASCSNNELKITKSPVCENVTLATHDCKNLPKEVYCPVETAHHGMEVTCRCKENCLTQSIRCWEGNLSNFNESMCTEHYESMELEFQSGEKVIASYKESPEVQCDPGTETILPGLITCTDGQMKWSQRPSCGKRCTELPVYVKCEQNTTNHGLSRINCTCTKTCKPVTITCDANGTWKNVSEFCEVPIDRKSENVVSTYNNGTYTFHCAKGYQTISGNNNFAVCVNGVLNMTAESEFRCEPISTTSGRFPTFWVSLGAVVLILVTIISIHCYRRYKETVVVTEHIGFVKINDRRIEINPVPASPTSVDSGMDDTISMGYMMDQNRKRRRKNNL